MSFEVSVAGDLYVTFCAKVPDRPVGGISNKDTDKSLDAGNVRLELLIYFGVIKFCAPLPIQYCLSYCIKLQ